MRWLGTNKRYTGDFLSDGTPVTTEDTITIDDNGVEHKGGYLSPEFMPVIDNHPLYTKIYVVRRPKK